MPRKSYLVAYDLSSPASLRKALRLVQPNRLGGQYSAHECCLSYPEAQELFAALSDLVEAPNDRIMLAHIRDARTRRYGRTVRTIPLRPALQVCP